MFTVKIMRQGEVTVEEAVRVEILVPTSDLWQEETGCIPPDQEQPVGAVLFTCSRGDRHARYLYGDDERAYIVNENGKTVASAEPNTKRD